MDYDYTKLLQLFIKLRHFHKKNEINIATKPILSKILATCLNFLFIFKFFLLFCNLIFKILRHTSFLVKNPLFLSVLLKKQNYSDLFHVKPRTFCYLIFPPFCFTWNNSRIQRLCKNNVSRETRTMKNIGFFQIYINITVWKLKKTRIKVYKTLKLIYKWLCTAFSSYSGT